MSNRLKELRTQAGLSRTDLALAAETDIETIQGIEDSSLRIASSKCLVRIAVALNTTVDEIFKDAGRKGIA